MKKLLTNIIIVCAGLAFAVSCVKPAEYNRTLGLFQKQVKLSYNQGSTPLLVYSNTNWEVALDRKSSWASLDRLGGYGEGQVVFSYAANYGRARKVLVFFQADGVRDTMEMVQSIYQYKNASGTTVTLSPEIKFESSSVEVPAYSSVIVDEDNILLPVEVKVPITCNFLRKYDNSYQELQIQVAGSDNNPVTWISDVCLSNVRDSLNLVKADVSFVADINYRTSDRGAKFTLKHIDANGDPFAASFTINQVKYQ